MEARGDDGADCSSWDKGRGRDDPARAAEASETIINMTNEACLFSK